MATGTIELERRACGGCAYAFGGTVLRAACDGWWHVLGDVRGAKGEALTGVVCGDWGERLGFPDRATVTLSDEPAEGFTALEWGRQEEDEDNDQDVTWLTFGTHEIEDSARDDMEQAIRSALPVWRASRPVWVKVEPSGRAQ